MKINHIYIGMNINEHRKPKGLTIDALAERIDITPQHLSNIINGKVGLSITTLINLCNTLDITPNDLLMDNLASTEVTPHLLMEVERVYADCTSAEIRHMLSVSSALKSSLRIGRETEKSQ